MATNELNPRQVRTVYLITYSRADVTQFPTRTSFSNAVLAAFARTPSQVLQWVCAQEEHADGGLHYHMAIKLDRLQRWLRVKHNLEETHEIVVHFSSTHVNYYTAWQYTTKEDVDFIQSLDHPVLANPPNTQAALEALTQQEPGRRRKRKARLSSYEVGEIAVDNNLKNRLQLLAFANAQKFNGKTDLAEFILNRGKKVVDEVLTTAWEMAGSEAALERAKLRRVDILSESLEGECVDGCGQQWLEQALDILQRNQIDKEEFCGAVKYLLTEGRGKYRNIMITGPTNCGKSFMLQPLTTIYRAFANPATTTYAWIGAAEAEVILLNDFRWNQQIIAWSDFLLLLEGECVHLPAPKTHYSRDIEIDSDVPIFCTSSQPIQLVRGGAVQERETAMMTVRWKHFVFNSQIPSTQQRRLKPCGRCFAALVLPRDDNPLTQ
ncbi:uncharacterized protein [Amphiura filiformis]|uniref:uncharacterized protein n=1 Tax=Amphiura filiformis TaxID=82378 RepID=UPI003B214AB3